MYQPSFLELTTDLEQELKRLHYASPTIRFYQRIWKKLALFLKAEHSDYFTEELGLRFLDEKYNFLEREQNEGLTQQLVYIAWVVRMLGDFQQHRCILRRYYKHRELIQTDAYKHILSSYVSECQRRQYSKVTQDHYCKGAEKFLSFLESRDISDCAFITSVHCSSYVKTWLGYQPKTVELQACALRSFLRYLYTSQQNEEDLSASVPSVRVYKHARIPSAWTADQVNQLLNVIDRGNPAGKRDYAMILLVARLGLRSIDVKRLKISDLHWNENQIEFVVSKTGRILSLSPVIRCRLGDY